VPLIGKSRSERRLRPRAALALLLVINLFNYIDRYILAAALPFIGAEMLRGDAAADEKKGLLATAFLCSYMVLSPVFGFLADRFSRWVLVGIGVILWSLASGASGISTVYTMLLITRMFVGVGEAAYGPSAPTIIADLYPVEYRGRILSWFYMATPVGSAIGYALGGVLAGMGHWRWAFYGVVPPGILLGLLCLLMPEPVRGAADAGVQPHSRLKLSNYLPLFKTRSYVLNCLGMTALTFAIGGISHWMPTYIGHFRHAADDKFVGIAFGAITAITGITATLLGGMAGDALRGRVRGSYFIVSAAGLICAFPLLLATLWAPFPLAWVFIFLTEFCLFFNTGPSNAALANVTHPSVRASAFALNIFFIHALGDAISPPIIGALSDSHGGNLNVGFGVVGAVILLGAALWLWGAAYLDEDTKIISEKSLANGD